MRTGASVPLIAGACTTDPYSSGGAFAFDVPGLPSDTWWFTGSAFIYIMLLAGGTAVNTFAFGGSFTFDADCIPSWTAWDRGSASNSLLVRVLTTLLPVVVLLRFMWTLLRWRRAGTTVPLIAGACAEDISALGGAFAFCVDALPLHSWWTVGTAII